MLMLVFAYFGPEATLPLASAVAAAAGVFLMGGRHALRVARAMARFAARSAGLASRAPAAPVSRARPASGRLRLDPAGSEAATPRHAGARAPEPVAS